jgi:hypothetical protein
MTQQYLNGELSLHLGEACDEPDYAMGTTLAALRRRVEDAPVAALPALAAEAVDAVDAACWAALTHGDLAAFDRECRACARLHEFATCAGLIP